jgi:type II secretory pathway component PulC
MDRFILVFYMATLTFSHWAWGNCRDLKEELKQMRAAQTQITNNLLDNYKVAGEQVSYTAIKMNTDSAKQRLYVREQALRSSKAHAHRLEKTEVIAHKLGKATDDLIKKLAVCIK